MTDREKRGDVDFDDIERMLAANEGPDHPRGRSRGPERHARKQAVTAAAVVLAIAALATGIALTRDSSEETPREAALDAPGPCPLRLHFRGVVYFGKRVPPPVEYGKVLGFAMVPRCRGNEPGRVRVARLPRVDPAAAIVSVGEPDTVYVARGRCSAVRGGARLLRCLRRGSG